MLEIMNLLLREDIDRIQPDRLFLTLQTMNEVE